jgi:hypothetical protein
MKYLIAFLTLSVAIACHALATPNFAQAQLKPQAILAWSDPTDNREALYIRLPDGACAYSVQDGILTISLCG